MSKKEFALSYLKLGFSIFPTQGKKPLVAWEKYQSEKPTEEQVKEWWNRWPNADIGVVTGAISGFVVVDIDGGEVPQLPPTAVSQTSLGHYQYFFKYPGFPVKNSAKEIAPNIDIRGDGGFVVVPPSDHFNKETGEKDFTYTWLIPPEEAGFAALPTWILEKFKKESQRVTLKESVNIPEGTRHDKLLSLANSLLSRKYAPNEVWLTLNEIYKTYQEPHDPDDLIQIFQDACQFIGSQQQVQENSTIVIPNALEFLKQEFGDTDWLVEGLIPVGGSGIIVAKRESYKTWLALYTAYCITKGLPLWDKFFTNKNKVLYITNDDPPRNFQKRLDTFSFDDSFFVYHQALPSFSIEQVNGSFEAVKKIIKQEGIGVLIVDILRNTHNKDSNTDKDAKLVFDEYKKLREANPSLVLLFLIHPSKEQQLEKRFGKRQSEEAVGSYYWEASVDTVLSLTKTTEDDVDQIVITVTKNKQSEKKIKPFIGIQRKGEGKIEFIYEEKIPDKLKVAEAKEYIQQILSEKTYYRKEIIDLCVADQICKSRTAEQALKELNDEERVTHTESKPHVYSLVAQSQSINDSANRNTNNDLRNAEPGLTQTELSYQEEVSDETQK
jgi:hypothetical protein